MSNRTKSFFESDHSNKSRPAQWQRRPNKQPLAETSNNIPPARPPIPATSQSKSKLNSFRLEQPQLVPNAEAREEGECLPPHDKVGGRESEEIVRHEEESLQRSARQEDDIKNSISGSVVDAASSTSNNENGPVKTVGLPHANTYPCTPSARLLLEDLIGNFDENAKWNDDTKESSPEEQVGWIPNSSSALLTPNRKRRRARSSSPSCPTTSQRQEAPGYLAGAVPPCEKQTPETDPAADLWKQYDEGKKSDGQMNLPDFSHLIAQASPRPLETPVKGAAFRRWASTGNDWPTSKSKRRRINGDVNVNVWQDETAVGSSGKSRVAAMVDRIQESLAMQKIASAKTEAAVYADAPSSSSPLPRAGDACAFKAVPAPKPPQLRPQANARDTALEAMQKNAESLIFAPLHLQSKARLPAFKRPSITKVLKEVPEQRQSMPPPATTAKTPPALVSEDLDEFGDDLDLSAEDLEELMTQPPPLDQRPLHQIPAHPDPPPQQSANAHHQAPLDAEDFPETVKLDDSNDDDDDDEFGGQDIDEDSFAQAEISATQAMRISPRKRIAKQHLSLRKGFGPKSAVPPNSPRSINLDTLGPSQRLQRYVVKQIVDGEYTNAKGRRSLERLLMAENQRSSTMTAITLRDSWAATTVAPGNIVHIARLYANSSVSPAENPPGQVTISDADTSPFLIVHPDHMLSATTVADSFDCIRKAVLQDRIKATGETSKAMVYGKILHEVFQQALSANRWEATFLAELVQRTVQAHLDGLWELGMTDTVLAIEEVQAKMGELTAWAGAFVREKPGSDAIVDVGVAGKMWMSVSRLIAVEEHVWSPKFGLKGNVDATIQTTVIEDPREDAKKLVIPFEVKTGRTTQSPAHRAQTALYTLLLSDRYDIDIKAGILYYLESSAMSRIAPPLIEIRQMVQQRNRLATYIHRARHPPKSDAESPIAPQQTQEIEESGLPALLKNPFKCGRCYAQAACFSYHALAENGSADTAGMIDDGKKNHSQTWHEAVGHLQLQAKKHTQAELLKEWFSKWDKLLTFEESELNRLQCELWTMTSAEREAVGRCFGALTLNHGPVSAASSDSSSVVDGIESSGGKINRFTYTFSQALPIPGHSFAEGTQLTPGEPVVVSSEKGQWALANGYVVAATRHDITVAVDRRLGNARLREMGFDENRNQSFRGIMTVGEDCSGTSSSAPDSLTLYRLDKDEFSNGLALIRNNLVKLMSSHPLHTKLREQIVLGSPPSFSSSSAPAAMPPSQLGDMNEDQRAAVSKVIGANDYALILGMPGTGKTTTIAHVIRALLAEGKSILLTSFTHTAVDNILLKIKDIAPANSILRLGVPAKINQQVQTFCQLASTPRMSIEDIEKAYVGSQIVATTCMGINHGLFNRRAFDVCIVDEASQITLPTSLGPLLHARKFVLVGDHYQLPPLVQNKAALSGGFDVSLFRKLSEEHPNAVTELGKQYRMCEDVMSLSNALIYNGKLRCGNDAVASRTLRTGNPSVLSAFHRDDQTSAFDSNTCGGNRSCWLRTLTSPERKVVFANTDPLGLSARETLTSGKNITNALEATLAAHLVLALLALDVPAHEIGIITLYRSQLALIRSLFRSLGISRQVEIDSADRFQGRDKEVVVLSMVRSNEAGVVGGLLEDWRRVNVALTRARSKLLVLGSRRTLGRNALLADFLGIVDDRGWAVELPPGATEMHVGFDPVSQQGLEGGAKKSRSPKKSSPEKKGARKMGSVQRSPEKVLRLSQNAANMRSPVKESGRLKKPGKVISGRGRTSKMAERASVQIFEDLTGED